MKRRSRMTGAKQAVRSMNSLPGALRTPMNAAGRKALRPTLNAARANVRANGNVESGEFLRSLTIKRDPNAPKDRPTHVVGPDPKKTPNFRVGHLLEFGTAPHVINGWLHPGARAFPWLRPAFEATKDQAIKIFGDDIGPQIERYAKRQAARRAKK